MDKFVNKVLVVLLAVAVFFTGAGITIANYCCSDCSSQSLLIGSHNCCDIHQDRHTDFDADAHKMDSKHNQMCADTENPHCSFTRVSIDLDRSTAFKPQLFTPFTWLSNNIIELPSHSSEIGCSNDCLHMVSPSAVPPRAYLSLLRVLII